MKRQTYILSPELIKKVKQYAANNDLKLTEAINLIIESFFKGKK